MSFGTMSLADSIELCFCLGTLERYREELDTIKAQNQAHEAEQRALKEQKLQNLQEAKYVQYSRPSISESL